MSREQVHSPRTSGLAIAGLTALISGVAVFVNGYGVREWQAVSTPTVYTTVKNWFAALILLSLLAATSKRRAAKAAGGRSVAGRAWRPLLAIGLIGGSVPFVLFFEGLARAPSSDAAFIHKTLFIWVAVLAVPILGERVSRLQILALAVLLGAQFALAGGLPALTWNDGAMMVMAATLLWSIEVIIAKKVLGRLPALTVGAARMGLGTLALSTWVVWSGRLGELTAVSPAHWLWAALAGTLLAGYVATWMLALQRCPAVDVSAVLVAGAVVTAVLDTGLRGLALPPLLGLVMLGVGVLFLVGAAARPAYQA